MRSGGGGRLYGQSQPVRTKTRETELVDRTRQMDALVKGTSLVPPALTSDMLTQALHQLQAHYANEARRQQPPVAATLAQHPNLSSSSLPTKAVGGADLLSFSGPFSGAPPAGSLPLAEHSSTTIKSGLSPQSPSDTTPPTYPALNGHPSRQGSPPDEPVPRAAAPLPTKTSSALGTDAPYAPLLFGMQAPATAAASPASLASPAGKSPAMPFLGTCQDVLSRCGLPTAARVRSVFAAAEAHSELGAMWQWFAKTLVQLFTEGLAAPAVLGFAENWERQMAYVAALAHGSVGRSDAPPPPPPLSEDAPKVSAALNAYAFELQGVPSLFTFVWAQLAALETATAQAATCHPSTSRAARAAARAAATAAVSVKGDGSVTSLGAALPGGADAARSGVAAAGLPASEDGGIERRRTIPFMNSQTERQRADGAEGRTGAQDTCPETSDPPAGATTRATDKRNTQPLGTATFPFAEASDRAAQARGGPNSTGAVATPSALTRAPMTEPAPPGGPTRQFAGTAHAFAKIQPALHTPPLGAEKLWSASVPIITSSASRSAAALPASQLSSSVNATPTTAEAPTVRRAPSARSAAAPTHTRTFHEMEQGERRAKLQRELGVPQVRSYGAERDAADYMRNMDVWREELLEAELPASQALLVSSTGTARTLGAPHAPVTHIVPSSPPTSELIAPTLPLPAPAVTREESSASAGSSASAPRRSAGSSPVSGPLAQPVAPSPNLAPLCASKARLSIRPSAVTVADPATSGRANHTVGGGVGGGEGASRRQSSTRTSDVRGPTSGVVGTRQSVPAHRAPTGVSSAPGGPAGGETSASPTSGPGGRARRRDWLDPLVMPASSLTDAPPLEDMTDDEDRVL